MFIDLERVDDRSGNGRDLIQPDATQRPMTVPDILDGVIASMESPARAQTPAPDYLDELLQDVAYEVIRREGVYKDLENHEWDAESVALAAQFRAVVKPIVDQYVTNHFTELD